MVECGAYRSSTMDMFHTVSGLGYGLDISLTRRQKLVIISNFGLETIPGRNGFLSHQLYHKLFTLYFIYSNWMQSTVQDRLYSNHLITY